ncbi:MAG: HAD family hydrolase [Patescibacteria group bacterium]
MIKAIVTDVDGVLVGDKLGINFPIPNEKVLRRLSDLNKKGMLVILCTGKFGFSIQEIIKKTGLSNPHISDGGAVIFNPKNNNFSKKHLLARDLATQLIKQLVRKNIYLECYGIDDYFIQSNQRDLLTEKRVAILQKEHIAVTSLSEHVIDFDLIKIVALFDNDTDKKKIEAVLEEFKEDINYMWSGHPAMSPFESAVITKKGASKGQAVADVLTHLGIDFSETLGIGDTLGDWHFMQHCQYVGTVGNISPELQSRAKTKGEGKYFIGKSVDEDAFLDIVTYFIR